LTLDRPTIHTATIEGIPMSYTQWTALAVGGLLCLGLARGRAAAGDERGFLNRVYKDADGTESKYVVFVPHDYSTDKEYPVILFLHGAGETLGGKKLPVEVGIGPAIKKHEKTFPFIVVIPQSHKRTWKADSQDAKRALAILDQVCKTYKSDARRVYLTGLSMGGYGTWSLAAAHPERWAAIAPVCGGGSPASAERIKDLPCWCFHGDADKAVPVARSRDMLRALWAAGGHPNYTEYPGVGHNSWDLAYGTQDLYPWLLKHKRK
jgi:predicted peptidase